jgi:hypothetical protein
MNVTDLTEMVDIVKRQTDYNNKKAEEKLLEFDLNLERVVRDYMGIKEKREVADKSPNQERYKMIRIAMDEIIANKKV